MKKFQHARSFTKWLPLFISALFLVSFSSCTIALEILDDIITGEPSSTSGTNTDSQSSYDDVDFPAGGCPSQLAASAFEYAKKYAAADTQYKYGAQDPLRSIQVDCSGLVIRCYRYALENSGYSLVQNDMSSSFMYQKASIPTTTPRRGDLVFMTYNNSTVSHVGIFDRFEGNQVYFIDATDQGKGKCVTERHYSKTDKKIVAYGIMKVKQ